VHERAALLRVCPGNNANRSVQDVCRRVVAHRGGTAHRLYSQSDGISHLEGCGGTNGMHSERTNWALRIAHLGGDLPAHVKDLPRIANLSAALRIKRGATNDQLPLVACRQRSDFSTFTKEPHDCALSVKLFIADELRLTYTTEDLFIEGGGHGDLSKRGLHATAATLALLSEGALKASTVNGDTALSGELNGEINRKPVRIVQLEGNLATERWASGWKIIGATANDALPCAEFGERITEQARTGIERSCELRLFPLDPFEDRRLSITQVRI
jgi:hypothetical protein